MIAKSSVRLVAAATVAFLFVVTGCDRDPNMLEPAPFPDDAEVFLDEFGPGVTYQAFGGSKVDALDIDLVVKYKGSRSMKFTVPSVNDPAGTFAGGAFVNLGGRDLTGYDALTFWAKASVTATIGVVGLGNDNSGTSKYVAQMSGLPVTTAWQKYIVPIPLSSKLDREGGLFQLAAGAVNGSGYEIWFDEVQFERLGTIARPRPAITSQTVSAMISDVLQVEGTVVTFDVGGTDRTVEASSGYFTFTSSDNAVATVDEDGVITAVGLGSADITARLGSVDAAGAVTVNVTEASPGPAAPAPTPTVPASDVISFFSNAYTDVAVDTWSAGFDVADVADVQIAGDDVKLYTNLVFAGVEFTSQPVDATAMTHFHMDIWTPDPTAAPAVFRIKLVDFGADGVFGGDDTEHELTFDQNTNPALATGTWVGLDIPLSDFVGLTTKGHLAQLIISGDPNTVYVDNVYLYSGGGGTPAAPAAPAPTPTVPESDVISLYSNAYTDVVVDTWSADWDNADLADVQVAGDDSKLYTNLSFAGIEFTSQPIDATAMTHFHLDVWTPDPTAAPAAFRIKLVDFGADGAFDGGDDVEHEITLDDMTTPALATGAWAGLDIPLSDFTGLTTTGHLAQLIISADQNTVYVDNVYFYGSGGTATEPTTAAPVPTFSGDDVISLFSNAYTDVTVDTWSADWDNADLADVQVAGDDVKLYTNLAFAGIEFTSQPIDASAMTHFSLDLWTPDPTAAPAAFRIKLVDFGADGAFEGGDDVEHELTFDATTTPALGTGAWIRLDIPLSDFAGLTTTGHLAQLIISGDPNTIYIDNVLLHK